MNTDLSLRLGLMLACLVAFDRPGAAQVVLQPNTLRGTIRFSNTNPDILSLLNDPGNEGMKYVAVAANSLPPAPSVSATSPALAPATPTSTSYQLTVDSDATGIAYGVTPSITLLDGGETYYFATRDSDPVVAGGPPVTVDFAECLGVATVRFVNAAGAPVPVDGGQIIASGYQFHRHTIPPGATEARIYLLGGQTHPLAITVSRGKDEYVDRVSFVLNTEVKVNCDEFSSVEMVIPETGELGRISGQVDMVGEFELTIDGRDDLNYPDSTGVIAQDGPFANRRWAALKGTHFSAPASGAYTLVNVPPSTLDPASPGYALYAQMYFRTNRQVESFRSPALGAGANSAVPVGPGQTVDVGGLFVISPGYLRGKVVLQGPPEAANRQSLFRGVNHVGDLDSDQDGVPDGLGTYGVYGSSVSAEGLDRLASGATLTASAGAATTDFNGVFNPANGAYEGNYELVLGGLKSERSLWKPSSFSLSLGTPPGTADHDYYSVSLSVTDRRDIAKEIVPSEATQHDLAYCFSEVKVVFRATSGTFYNPQIRFSNGAFKGNDFQGQPADYQVYLDIAAGTPFTQEGASNVGAVVLYLPEGTYRLLPSVTPGDTTFAATGLEPIDLTVGCGQRLEIEQCLQVELPLPSCLGVGPVTLQGNVRSCSNQVARVTYELNGATAVTVCENCGLDPAFRFEVNLPAGDNSITVRATDTQGGTSSITTSLRSADTEPPTIVCPADLSTPATRPCGAPVSFRATATDACDSAVQVVCVPPSGSVFPIGETIVNCRASDAAGNFAECSFKVTVTPGQFMAPMLADVLPKVVALAGGTPLTVYGDNFTEDDEVWLDGQPLLFPVLINAQEIAGQAPALSTGAHELQIRRCGEIVARLSRASETRALPHLISVEPSQAFARGGNALLVRGTNFTAATRIRIGFPSADGISNLLRNASLSEDGASIIGEVPPLPADELLGPRDVIAEDDRGQDVLPRGLTYLPNPTETDPQVLSLRELQASSARPVEAEWRNGFPSGLLTRVRVTGATPEARARTFVRRFQDLLQVQNPDAELEVAGTQSEGLDDVKLRQNYEGVPVFGSEMVVTLEQDEVVAMTGNLLPIAEVKGRGLKGVPTLTSEQAVEAAKFQEGIQLPLDQLDPTAELMVYDQSLFAPTPLDSHLCWKIRINYADSELMVDAHSGEIVARLPLFRSHGFDLDIQDAEHEANAQSDKCFNTSTDTDVADEDDFDSDYDNDLDAVLANRFARDCWFYFHDVFGWHSYDNDQSQLEIFIHTTMNPANIAQWATGCDLIQFTDGGVDYDVMVHEFTHGIVASTSKLVYQFQSGALDESYADTMGVIADRERGEVENPGLPLNWIIGENLRGPLTPVGVRNFQDPTSPPPPRAAQPDRFANLCCAGVGTPNQANDFGGVHSNSGIPNKAGYLMIEGGSFQGFLVRGMGMDKTRHVKFWALRNLPANASFADARAREIAAAESFVSRQEHGFTALDVCTVRNAWAAVGVGVGDSNCDGKEDTLNDLDGDLIPNQLDNCPVTANPKQENNDRDRYGNVCDNCPDIPNDGQEDMDGDKIGDVCDKDRDGDGCLNEKDQDPNSNQHRIGSAVSPTCPDQSSALYGFAGGNSDCDPRVCLGLFEPLDCEDLDDDNDGIPDDQDPCPVGKLAKTIQGDCTVVGADCPRIPKGWWRTCLGGGCVQFYARVLDRINPNPFQDAIIDHVSIVNQTIYLQPNVGVSLAATAKQIAPVARVGLQANEPRLLRLEIWRRATDTEPPRLEAVVADFDPSALKLEQVELGSMLAFTPGVGTEPPTLGAVWHVGDFPVNASLDSDGDGIPDGWEINHGLNPRDPTDAAFDTDGDGLSDLEEYQLGTDMSSPTSRLAILFGLRQNGRFIVQFNGPTGRRCQLERTTGLGPASWSTVGTPVRLQGDTATLTDDAASAGQAVYRVRLLPD